MHDIVGPLTFDSRLSNLRIVDMGCRPPDACARPHLQAQGNAETQPELHSLEEEGKVYELLSWGVPNLQASIHIQIGRAARLEIGKARQLHSWDRGVLQAWAHTRTRRWTGRAAWLGRESWCFK